MSGSQAALPLAFEDAGFAALPLIDGLMRVFDDDWNLSKALSTICLGQVRADDCA